MTSTDMETARPPTAAFHHPNNDNMEYGAIAHGPSHVRKKFVLCFDGTGNKFSGTESDSNILKIYRMLDRNGDDQFHYYQPGTCLWRDGCSNALTSAGIGTYVTKANGSMSRSSRLDKFKSWYAKAKDSAIGKHHVILKDCTNSLQAPPSTCTLWLDTK
jgi:hypothetical protein